MVKKNGFGVSIVKEKIAKGANINNGAVIVILLASMFLTGIVNADDPNLVGWWKFDDDFGSTAADSSVNGNSGILFGEPIWVTGRINSALKFDGNGVSMKT